MWIIPKTISDIFPFAQGSGDSTEDSKLLSQQAAASLWSRGKPRAAKSWHSAWKKATWIQRLFLRMYANSMVALGMEGYIASLPHIHAKVFQSPESSKGKQIPAISGLTLLGSSERLEHLIASSKMSATTLTLASTESPESYKKWATALRRDSLQRRTSTFLISESDFSFSGTTQLLNWPTPQNSQGGVRGSDDRPLNYQPQSARSLQAVVENWPTPSAAISNDGETIETIESWEARKQRNLEVGNNGNGMGTPITIAAFKFADSWPTPTTNMTTGPGTEGRGGGLESANRSGQLERWETPTVRDCKNPNHESSGNYRRKKEAGWTIDLNDQAHNWKRP